MKPNKKMEHSRGDIRSGSATEGIQPFFCPPRHADDDSNLSPNEVLVLAIISDKAGSWDGTCWKTDEDLAEITGWTTRTIRTHRISLIRQGRVTKEGKGLRVQPYTDNPTREKELYFIIPRELYEIGLIRKKHARDFRVLMRIARRCGNGGECTESIPNMSKGIRVGKDHIWAALNRLEELDLIIRNYRHKKTNRIQMVPLPRRQRNWPPEDCQQIAAAASIMLKNWEKYPYRRKNLAALESQPSIINAIKHSLVEHVGQYTDLVEILNEMIAGARTRIRSARRSKSTVYLNQFIRSGRWQDPLNEHGSWVHQQVAVELDEAAKTETESCDEESHQ